MFACSATFAYSTSIVENTCFIVSILADKIALFSALSRSDIVGKSSIALSIAELVSFSVIALSEI